MEFMTRLDIPKPPVQINYQDKILLVGSCFTEHIGNALSELRFPILQNPNGILFDPLSVSASLESYLLNDPIVPSDFFRLGDVWHSWAHHSRFSNTDLTEAVDVANAARKAAHAFLQQAGWLVITLGSAYSYGLTALATATRGFCYVKDGHCGVANCHRAPAQWFEKKLLDIETIRVSLQKMLEHARAVNPGLNVIFTVSPVRHLRDGVIANNRSKARLIEVVHALCAGLPNAFYFPAYELVIDVLRDYRFYDVDLAHPNYMATEFVLNKFTETWLTDDTRKVMEAVRPVITARRHRPMHEASTAHREFLAAQLSNARILQTTYPFLDLSAEIEFFQQSIKAG